MFKVPALFIPKLIVDYLIVVGLNAVACRRCRFLGILLQMIITPGQGCQQGDDEGTEQEQGVAVTGRTGQALAQLSDVLRTALRVAATTDFCHLAERLIARSLGHVAQNHAPAGDFNTQKESLSERPKSMSFTFCPLCVIMMLEGFRSR